MSFWCFPLAGVHWVYSLPLLVDWVGVLMVYSLLFFFLSRVSIRCIPYLFWKVWRGCPFGLFPTSFLLGGCPDGVSPVYCFWGNALGRRGAWMCNPQPCLPVATVKTLTFRLKTGCSLFLLGRRFALVPPQGGHSLVLAAVSSFGMKIRSHPGGDPQK